jgi:hypothetical protein
MSLSFDPTLPVDGSLISAGELRNQLNSLNNEISDTNSNMEGRSFKPNLVDDLSSLTISNPPTKVQVETVRDKLNELIAALKV